MRANPASLDALPQSRLAAACRGARSALLALGLVGLLAAAPQAARAGNSVDLAPDFNGSTHRAYATDNASLRLGQNLTIEAWVRPTGTCASVPCNVIIREYGYSIYALGGKWWYRAKTSAAAAWSNVDTGVPVRVNEWVHLALVREETSGQSGPITVYVDGVARHVNPGTSRWDTATAAPVGIGGYVGVSTPEREGETYLTEPFPGRIDEVRLWNVARSAAQVGADMHTWGPASASGLVAYWDFNGVSGTTVPNRAASGASGTDLTMDGERPPSMVDVKETTRNPSTGYTVVRFPRSYLTEAGGWIAPRGVTSVDYLVLGGGGGGGAWVGGGGGGGGMLTGTRSVTTTANAITVGAGGVGTLWGTGSTTTAARAGTNGQSSAFADVTVLGGGRGGSYSDSTSAPQSGGSGGGGGNAAGGSGTGSGATLQGYAGGTASGSSPYPGGGGGGAGGAGGAGSGTAGGAGGAGRSSSITGTAVLYGGGGGGGVHGPEGTAGAGTNGGGNGSKATTTKAGNGTAGLGGGGGGGGNPNYVVSEGGDGGSGLVIVSYAQTLNPKSLASGASATVTAGAATGLGLGTSRVSGYTTETVRATLSTTTGTLSATANGTTLSGTGTATLTITGAQDAVNAAIGSATLTATAPIPTQVTLQIETAPTTQIVDGVTWTHSSSTGHFYTVGSTASGMDWRTARGLAEGLTLGSGTGFLASITSSAENEAVRTLLAASGGAGYIGGERRSGTQEWHWTGRDTARQFGSGGTAVSGQYTNWGSGEPSGWEEITVMANTTGIWYDCNYTTFHCYVTRFVAEVEPPASRSTHTVGFQRSGAVAALQGGTNPLGLGASLIDTARFGSESLTATLTASAGTVTVTAGTGVTGSGTATVTITGSVANLNTALNSAAVTPSGTGASTVTLSYAPTAATSGSYVYRDVAGEERFYIKNASLPTSTGNLNWAGAYSGAQTRYFAGLTGYLTTTTSNAEREWVKANVLGTAVWINGQDSTAEGQWLVDGRDAFAVVADGPYALPGLYAPWDSGQPDASGDGLVGNYQGRDVWDDMTETATAAYVVEFQPITTTYAIDVTSTAPSFTTVPATDRSRQFAGSPAAVGVLDASALDVSSAFTLEAWVKPSATSGEAVIAAKENAYALAVRSGDLSYALHNGTGWSWVSTGITIANGTWTHIAFAKNGVNVAVHINGSATAAYTNASQPATLNDSALPFTVGARGGACTTLSGVCGTAYSGFFPGLIGDVRLWGSARTGAQIAGSYDKRLAADVLTWFLDEASGSVAYNSAMGGGSALNGTYSATTASTDVPTLATPTTVAGNDSATYSGFLPGYEAGGAVTFAVGSQGTKGTVAITAATGAFTYTPTAGTSGLDSFTYTVSRNGATSSPQTVGVSITDTTPPTMTITKASGTVAGGGTTTVTFTSNEATTDFTAADVTATFGTLIGFAGSGAVYTATFTGTATAPGTATISVAAGAYTDAAGNANTQGSTTISVTSAISGRTSFLGNGTIGTSGTTYIVQRFLSGTTAWTVPQGVTSLDYLVIGGGGGGGSRHAGGGGAGGLRSSVSPTGGGASAETALTVTPGQSVSATVGGGGAGAGASGEGVSGSPSTLSGSGFTTVTATGGGRGAGHLWGAEAGGSGGGSSSGTANYGAGTAGQGYRGGQGIGTGSTPPEGWAGGGGGGAGGLGQAASNVAGDNATGGAGGAGVLNAITGSSTCYAGGGGGGNYGTSAGAVGAGGGCGGTIVGGSGSGRSVVTGGSGAANTGAGGGGGGFTSAGNLAGGSGGSGLVVVRYAIPAVSVPDLDAASDLGSSSTDNITSSTTPTFTGSAPVGASVQLYVGSTATGSPCTADATTGAWSCTTGTLAAGTHAIKAVSTTVVDQTVTSESSALSVTVDTTPPTVSSFTSAQASPTNAASFTYALSFSEAVTGVAAGDFSYTGTATGCVFAPGADSGSSRTVTVSGCSEGTVTPRFAATGAADAAGNTGPASAETATTTITRDVTAPTVSSFTSAQATPTTATSFTYALSFSEAVTGVAAGDFSYTGTATGCVFAPGADSGSSRTVTVSGCSEGTVTPRFAATGAADAAGNTGPASAETATTTITYDVTAPTVSSFTEVTPSGTSAVYSVTFSESVTGLTTSAISASGTSTGWTAATVTGSGAGPYTITLSNANAPAGTVRPLIAAATVQDTAGNAYAGGNGPIRTIHPVDRALGLNGTSQFGSTSNALFGQRTRFTIEAWSNPTSATCPTTARCEIIGRDGDLNLAILAGTYQFVAYWGTGLYTGWVDSGVPARAGEWTHTAVVRDGTSVTLYVNGVAVKSATLSANTAAPYAMASYPFRVGYIGYGSHYFPGQIDQVRYWETARTASELASGMHAWLPPSTTGLVGFWDFNDGSGATAANQAPNAAASTDLTLTGSPTWPEAVSSTTDAGGRTTVTFSRTYLSISGGWTVPSGMANLDVLAVGGGGGGGDNAGGGGGGGGSSEAAAEPVTAGGLVAVTVGVGGRPGGSVLSSSAVDALRNGGAGSASTFGSVTANGGAGGAAHWSNDICAGSATVTGTGGAGGTGSSATGGAGGSNTSASVGAGTAGGAGRASTITGTSVTYGGGGGGGGWSAAGGAGGSGGGGAGTNNAVGTSGTIGLGGGGGGGGAGCARGGWGGSGIVILAHDVTAPSAPTIDLQAGSDTGASSTDDLTSDTTPTFAGSGLEAGATVVLTATSGSSTSTCAIAAASIVSGAATCTFSPALAAGTWSVTARQTDQMGNQSAASTAVSITIDASAPTLTLAAAAASATGTALSFTLTGDEAITCSTVSNAAGTDFTLTGITSLGTIAQTSSTLCTIPATSPATVGERLDAVLTAAGTFSVQDAAGNAQTVVAGSPATTVVNRSTGATPSYPGATGGAPVSAGAGTATAIGSAYDITDPGGVGWSSVTATVTTTAGTLTAVAGDSGATVNVASNTITISGTIANVEKVLNSTGTAYARISATSAGSATVTVTVEPTATHTIGGTTTYFSSATGHYYRLHETGISWDAAHLAARQDTVAGAGGYLVTIRSSAEDDFVRGTVTGGYSSGYFLLGGRKCASTPAAGALCASNGTMQWVPGANAPDADTTAVLPASAATPTTWAPWAAGQPNDGTSASLLLEYVWVDSASRYRFNDAARTSGYSIREYGSNTAYTAATTTAAFTFTDASVPTYGPIGKTGAEDTTLAFTQSDFTSTYADVNTSAPVSVTIVSLPATGTLRLAGVDVTAGQVVPYADLGGLTYVPAANANGAIAFLVRASDGTNLSSPATTLTMTLTAVNDAPTLATPTAAAYTDTSANDAFTDATGTLGGADVDTGAVLAYGIQGVTPGVGALTVSSTGTYGTLTVTRATGAYAFAPNRTAINARTADASETFTVTVSDGTLSASATYTVSITAANDTPALATPTAIAIADTAAADTFPNATGTLAGTDRDAGQTLTYALPSGAAQSATVGSVAYDVAQTGTYGTLRLVAADGRYVFVPNAAAINALGADTSESFSVRVSDGTATATATLTVSITAANDTPVLTAPTGASLTDTAAADAFANQTGTLAATDAEGATPAYGIQGITPASGTSTLRGTYGTLTVTAAGGGWTYDPDDAAINALSANATDAFTVTASDGATAATGTVTITITGANDTPTMPVPLGATIVDTAGADTFTAVQGALSSADAEGTARTYGITGGTGAGTVTKAGTYGTLVLDATAGTWTYTPSASAVNARSADATDDFTVTASDGSLSTSRTLGFAITGVNDTPILALPTSGVVRDSVANSGSLPNLTGSLSATDAETASASLVYGFTGVTPSAGSAVYTDPNGYGTITLTTATGAWTFDPAEAAVRAIPNGSAQTVSVTATATDGGSPALTDTKTLQIRIEGSNNRPIMSAPVGGSLTDTSGADAFAAVTGALVASDYDLGSTLTYGITGGTGTTTITKAGTYGTLAVVAATGAWTYTPTASAVNGAAAGQTDDFAVTVTDSDSPPESVTRQLSITIAGTNDRPLLSAVTGPTFTDTAAADDFQDAMGTLTATDAEGTARTYAIETASGAVQTLAGAYGTLTVVSGSGAWTYAPNDAAINGLAQDATDVFTVSASDGALSATRTLTVAITAADDTPTLAAPAAVSLTDTAAADTFGLQAGALVGADPESRPLEYAITGGTDQGATVERVGAYGTLAVAKSTGAFVFTPNATAVNQLAASTSESFTVRVTDGALTTTRPLTVSITAVKETPVVTWADPAAIVYGTALSGTQLNAAASGFAGAVAGTFTYAEGATARAAGDVLNRGAHSIVATFTPTDAAVYNGTTDTSTITVTPAAQTINVAAASTSLVYGGTGTTLSHSFTGPNGGATPTFARVSGPCTVSGANVAVTGAGDCVVTASVDEDDSTGNYSDATSAPLTIGIAKATLTLTAQDKQKRATNADPALTYLVAGYVGSDTASAINTSGLGLTRAVGEVAGTYPITFTGAATAANYDFQYTGGTFTITDRDVPVATWATPAGITYGDPLTVGMLNASAAFGGSPVPGAFAYSTGGTPVAAGTVLGNGSHVITATFTPTDTSQYAPGSTAQVTVTVARKGLTVSGVGVLDKDFDGTATATLDLAAAALVGVVGSDAVTLDASAGIATFPSAEVGTGRAVTVSGLALAGADAGQYALTQPAATATIRAVPPGPPTTVTASAGDGQAIIEWSAPAFTGGQPITGYTVTSSPGARTCSWTRGPLTCTITRLTNGNAYTFTVTAANAVGTSAASSASSPVTPAAPPATVASAPTPAPTALDDGATVERDGSATVQVGCAASARVCSATVTMFVGSTPIATSREQIAAGETQDVALALPLRLQRQLAEEGVLRVRVVTVIDVDGSKITVESTIDLTAPPAEALMRPRLKAAADGTTTITGDCQGTAVTRCDGTVTLYASAEQVERAAGRAAERIVVGRSSFAGPAGRQVATRTRLTAAGLKLLRDKGAIRVTPQVTMKGSTRVGGALPSFVMTRMTQEEWLRRALSTLYVGGRPRADLNNLLDQTKRGVVDRRTAASIIERDIMDARRKARARAAALPTPPRSLQPIATLLLRAFDQSLAANRAYVLWLRSDRVEDTQGWRLSRRASATKAELMARFAEAGRPYGIAVPRASTLWP